MLCLDRKIDQTIVIDPGHGVRRITITVIGFKGQSACIGIDAPREVTVHRGEIQSRIDGDDE